MINKQKYTRIILAVLIMAAIAILLECFLFNFRFWQSSFFKGARTDWSPVGMEISDSGKLKVTDIEHTGIEFSAIDAHVDNVYINIVRQETPDAASSVNIYMTDEGHALYTKLADREVVPRIKESHYIRVHLYGKSEKILVKINNVIEGATYDIEAALNIKRPFLFKWWRLLLIFAAICLLVMFRPGSELYKVRLNLCSIKQLIFTLFFIMAAIALFSGIAKVFSIKNWQDNKITMQYSYLAESLTKGHAYLDFDPPKSLAGMDNPYDAQLRAQVLAEAGESVIIDYAYYNGRYYSYFGIVPVLMFYLPYLLLTGKALNTAIPILIMTILFIITVFWFLETLVRRFFKNTSLGLYIILCNVLIAGAEITYCVQMATLYSLPIIMGITFDLLGITCWLRAVQTKKISKVYLIVGALLIALVMGCRPQLVIALLFAFPIFYQSIKERLFFSIRGIGNTLCVIVPFLIIGLGVMYYNYIRFDSPFNFGATYNLTGFDMVHRGIDLSRFGLGFFEYLLQPFKVQPTFPYLYLTAGHMTMVSDYQGQVINEPFFGGFFAFNIFGILIFKLKECKQRLKEKGIWGFTVLMIVTGIVLVAVDIQMVGMTLRYLTDFSVFLMTGAVIVSLALTDMDNNDHKYKVYLKWIVVLSIVTIMINYYTLIATGRYNNLVNANPLWFYRIKYQLLSF